MLRYGADPRRLKAMVVEREHLLRMGKPAFASFGRNALDLVAVEAFARRLMAIRSVVTWLTRHEPLERGCDRFLMPRWPTGQEDWHKGCRPASMRYWSVNQNQTYRHEVTGGYLWSPKRNANSARNPFYETMREVAPGDLILSFVDTRLVAIGIAPVLLLGKSQAVGVRLRRTKLGGRGLESASRVYAVSPPNPTQRSHRSSKATVTSQVLPSPGQR